MNKNYRALIGILFSLFAPIVNAEYFLSTYVKELNTSKFPTVNFKLLVHDFSGVGVLGNTSKCIENARFCYKITIYENGSEVSKSAHSIDLIDAYNDILEISYQSFATINDDINLTIRIDTDGYHNSSDGNVYSLYKTNKSTYKNKSEYSNDGKLINFEKH